MVFAVFPLCERESHLISYIISSMRVWMPDNCISVVESFSISNTRIVNALAMDILPVTCSLISTLTTSTPAFGYVLPTTGRTCTG